MASEQFKKVLELAKAREGKFSGSPSQMRQAIEAVTEKAPADVKCEPVDAGGVKAEWIAPPGADANRVILYLHGGAYVFGSINTHRATVVRIAQASGMRGLALDYRLAPEHPFPAALEDATAAYRWLLARGYAPKKIAIAGDSAGGGLTLATLVALRDAKTPLPAAAVCISPWTDLEGTGTSMKTRREVDPIVTDTKELLQMAKYYVGGGDPRDPLVSPIHADLRGLPPLLIQVGDAEVLLDDSVRVAERARAAGVNVTLEVWPEMVHVWHAFALFLPEAQQAIDKMGDFIRAHTK